MAALGERDMRRILGDNYEAGRSSEPVTELLTRRRKKKDTVEDRKFTAFGAVLMGVGLIASAFETAKGQAFVIQNIVAALLIVAGGIWYLAARRFEQQDLT